MCAVFCYCRSLLWNVTPLKLMWLHWVNVSVSTESVSRIWRWLSIIIFVFFLWRLRHFDEMWRWRAMVADRTRRQDRSASSASSTVESGRRAEPLTCGQAPLETFDVATIDVLTRRDRPATSAVAASERRRRDVLSARVQLSRRSLRPGGDDGAWQFNSNVYRNSPSPTACFILWRDGLFTAATSFSEIPRPLIMPIKIVTIFISYINRTFESCIIEITFKNAKIFRKTTKHILLPYSVTFNLSRYLSMK